MAPDSLNHPIVNYICKDRVRILSNMQYNTLKNLCSMSNKFDHLASKPFSEVITSSELFIFFYLLANATRAITSTITY